MHAHCIPVIPIIIIIVSIVIIIINNLTVMITGDGSLKISPKKWGYSLMVVGGKRDYI